MSIQLQGESMTDYRWRATETSKQWETGKTLRWCPLIRGWVTEEKCFYCIYSRDATVGRICDYREVKSCGLGYAV